MAFKPTYYIVLSDIGQAVQYRSLKAFWPAIHDSFFIKREKARLLLFNTRSYRCNSVSLEQILIPLTACLIHIIRILPFERIVPFPLGRPSSLKVSINELVRAKLVTCLSPQFANSSFHYRYAEALSHSRQFGMNGAISRQCFRKVNKSTTTLLLVVSSEVPSP